MINRLICYQDGRKSVYGTHFTEERYWYIKYIYKYHVMNSNSVMRTRMRKNNPSVVLLILLQPLKIKNLRLDARSIRNFYSLLLRYGWDNNR